MAMDFARLRDAIKTNLISDPDNKYTSGMDKPVDSDELDAWLHYVAKGIVEELTLNAELDGVANSDIAVSVDPGTGEGSTLEDGPLSGGIS